MCRSIKTLAHLEPPASDEEMRAAALQFVRKLSGANRPSRANELAFDRAVDDVTAAASRLLRSLTTSAPPRHREEDVRKTQAQAAPALRLRSVDRRATAQPDSNERFDRLADDLARA